MHLGRPAPPIGFRYPSPVSIDDGVFPGPVWVHYGQIELETGAASGPVDWEDFFQYSPAGLIDTRPDHAIMLTGRHTGSVGFTVVVAEQDPGPDLIRYEDVVETDFEASDGSLALVEWAGEETHDLPPLPRGPGTYRLRYHARGMDEASGPGPDTEEEIVDEYLLQIWPAPPAGPAVLQVASDQARYWLTDKR
jgi:hypothetical protein